MTSLALYHPQIPQNTGTLLRLSSCMGIHLHLIRPFGFLFDNRKLKRAGMDYISTADYEIYDSFEIFIEENKSKRMIALDITSDHAMAHHKFRYRNGDILIVGSEHYGFLEEDLNQIQKRVKIPMLAGRRSLNMAIAATIVVSEAMSQLKSFN